MTCIHNCGNAPIGNTSVILYVVYNKTMLKVEKKLKS